jgi:hypothetical protein
MGYSLAQLSQIEALEKSITQARKRVNHYIDAWIMANRSSGNDVFSGWPTAVYAMNEDISSLLDQLHTQQHAIDRGGYIELRPCPGGHCEILREIKKL